MIPIYLDTRDMTKAKRKVDLEKYAKAYDNMMRFNPMHKEVIKTVHNDLVNCLGHEHAWNIADFGAGTGLITEKLAKTFSKSTIYAVENSPGFLLKLQDRTIDLDNVIPVFGDVESDIFKPGSLDAIFMIHTLNFTKHAKEARVIDCAFRALKKGGYLICADIGRVLNLKKHKQRVIKYAIESVGITQFLWIYLRNFEAVKQNRIFVENQLADNDIHPLHTLAEFCSLFESRGFEILLKRSDLYLGDDDYVVARKPG